MQLDDTDAVTVQGTKPTVTVTFPITCTIPANGTVLKIWGKTFTVNNGSDFSGNTFKVVASGVLTALNFARMIDGNLFFTRDTKITFAGLVGTITWNECREQANFSVGGMVFTALTAFGGSGSYLNGVSPVFVDGLKVAVQLVSLVDLVNPESVTEIEAFEPDKLCTEVGVVCVDYRNDIAGLVHTLFPELTSTSFISSIENGRSLIKPVQIKYGWVFRTNCEAKTGTFIRGDYVIAINAAFEPSDVYGIRKYWPNHPDGYPPGQTFQKFLTTQPFGTRICKNSFSWLWMLNNYRQTVGPAYKLRASFTGYRNGLGIANAITTINDSAVNGNGQYQPVNFNTSPARAFSLLGTTDLDYYEVLVIVTNGSNLTIQVASETLRYVISACGCDATDIYFLTPAGGYGTLLVDITNKSVDISGNEINIYQSCSFDFVEQNTKGGRTITNIRAYEKFTITARSVGNTPEDVAWFKNFITSPVKFIKKVVDGINVPLKFIIDEGSVELIREGEYVELTANCYLPDIPVQNPANQ